MPILINLFEITPATEFDRDDKQYNQYRETKRLKQRLADIEKAKLDCCGVTLERNEPKLTIVDKPRFIAIVAEGIEIEKQILDINKRLNDFDPFAKEARELGVQIPTCYEIGRAAIRAGNQLMNRRAITRSRIEELLGTRPDFDAVAAISHPSVSQLEIGNSELDEQYKRLLKLHERAEKLL